MSWCQCEEIINCLSGGEKCPSIGGMWEEKYPSVGGQWEEKCPNVGGTAMQV